MRTNFSKMQLTRITDLIIGRIKNLGDIQSSSFDHKKDYDWSTLVTITMGVNPNLEKKP